MSRLDCGAADVKAALEDVSTPTSKNEWYVFARTNFAIPALRTEFSLLSLQS